MKNRYRQRRDAVIRLIGESRLGERARIMEQDAGLHFLLRLETALPDGELQRRAAARGLRLAMLSDYDSRPSAGRAHILVVNYAGMDLSRLPEALERLAQVLDEEELPCTTN